MPEDQTEYERGLAAGQVLSRLDSHDDHLNKINGSMERVADELKSLNLNVQHMADAAEADRARAVVVAEALEKADRTREKTAARHWTPIERMIAIGTVVVPLLALLAFILISTHVIK
jgi:hypothetical protein